MAAIGLLVFLAGQAAIAVSAVACSGGGSKEPTTLTTSLSGEGKEGGEITILEGSKAKDKATLAGKNASEATGKVDYDLYSDSKCEHLVIAAGAVTVTSGSVPASNEEELEAGKTYYWQATYEGDSKNSASTSSCGSEILNVKAKTSLSTKLSGESKEGGELTIIEGAKATDKATLSGTNSSTAGGKLVYKIYSDKECKTLVKEAGEVTVSSGSVPASNEESLEGAMTYYWQATYKGDALHQESTSSCGSEVLTVKAKTSLSSELTGEESEGEEITILEGSEAEDKSSLSGTHSSTAGGTAVYKVYSDSECKDLVTEAGDVTVSSGSIPASSEEELEGGKTYYWQTTYEGDALHQGSSSKCGSAVLKVKALTCTFPYCEPTITPGVKITTGLGDCTAGPIMSKGAEMFLLTAGHCFGAGSKPVAEAVQSRYPDKEPDTEREIGKNGEFTNTNEYDLAEVKIEKMEWLLKGGAADTLLVEWQGAGKAAKITSVVGAVAANKVGEERCHTGAVSDEVECGKIVKAPATFSGTKKCYRNKYEGRRR